MNEILNEIKNIYLNHDFSSIKMANKTFQIVIKLLEKTLCNLGEQYTISNILSSPSAKIYVKFPLSKGKDNCYFFVDLDVSKIAKCYIATYSFAINNPSPQKIEPLLEGLSAEPYTIEQASVGESIMRVLDDSGYVRIPNELAAEVIPEIEMPANNFFGTQMTVETALFHDVLEIFPDCIG